MKIFKIGFEDLAELSLVHVQAWQETYRGIIPDTYLDCLSAEQKYNQWKIALTSAGHYGDLVRDEDGVFGFLSGGPMRGDSSVCNFEVYALYVLRKYHRLGIGKNLLQRFFRNTAAKEIGVWVLRDNVACRFYEKIGGFVIKSRDISIGEVKLKEDFYLIKNLFHTTD